MLSINYQIERNARWSPKLLMYKAFLLCKLAFKTDRNCVFYHHLFLPGSSVNVLLFLITDSSANITIRPYNNIYSLKCIKNISLLILVLKYILLYF